MGSINKDTIRRFLKEKERHLSAGALLLGFFIDSLTLSRIDLLFDNLILLSYLSLAIIIIFLQERIKEGTPAQVLSYLLQYAFGGLFSGFIIFYSQSAGFIGSWLFLIIFLLLLVGNEFYRDHYRKVSVQLSVLFVALFSYTIFLLPLLTGIMGVAMFLLSGIVSLLGIFILVQTYTRLSKQSLINKSRLSLSIIILYLLFNTLYFTNIIPPIPLSLKELSLAHHIERLPDGTFRVKEEKRPWYQYFNTSDITYIPSETIYAFSSVFAPTKITTAIEHRWLFYNQEKKEWVTRSSIPFVISGGRAGGFRGFTFKNALEEGRWRIDVVTEGGQIIGRKVFMLTPSPSPPSFKTLYK